MTEDAKIIARDNGPLVVKGIQSLRQADGKELECKPVMALCRCGASKNKPFCDSSHKEIGFDSNSGTPAGRDKVLVYEGQNVSVSYNPLICSHAAECGRIAGKIFNPQQKPWIQPDNGTVDDIRSVVAACPSGALALGTADKREHLTAQRAQVQIEKNGPYWVVDVSAPVAPQATGASERKYVLCRCGKSGNKPFCDGTHRDEGWSDA